MTKQKQYEDACFRYGFLPLCYLINEYQEQENYEECAVILAAIKAHNSKYHMNLPTVWSCYAIGIYKDHLRTTQGITGDIDLNHILGYAEKIKMCITKLK